MATAASATALALLAGVLLPCGGDFRARKLSNGDKCSHHAECHSDCCLVDLDLGGAICAAKAGISMACLPQTKGNTNIVCPCRMGLTCVTKDPTCPRRCHFI